MGGGCCVMDNPIGNFFKDIFCSDSGSSCGYHPGPSENELHAKKIADELAQMKENIRNSTEKDENELMDYINRFMNSLLDDLEEINEKQFGGKALNINIAGIRQQNESLKNNVKGYIGNVIDERLVLTDKELSVILEERNDKKRGKNFDNFCDKIKRQALLSLRSKIESTVKEQSTMVEKEIRMRLNEVEENMKKVQADYQDVLNSKKKNDGKLLDEKRMNHIYVYGLNQLLLDELRE